MSTDAFRSLVGAGLWSSASRSRNVCYNQLFLVSDRLCNYGVYPDSQCFAAVCMKGKAHVNEMSDSVPDVSLLLAPGGRDGGIEVLEVYQAVFELRRARRLLLCDVLIQCKMKM